jgi:anti-anti-sigma factor
MFDDWSGEEDRDGAGSPEGGTAWLRIVGDTAVVVLGGEHDLGTAESVERTLRAAEDRDPALIAIDLAGCDFIDSTVLRALLHARERAVAGDRRLVLLVPPGPSVVRNVLELSGLADVFTAFASLGEALRAGMRLHGHSATA